MEELRQSNEEIKKRIKRSPDNADSLAHTFWPIEDYDYQKEQAVWDLLSAFY